MGERDADRKAEMPEDSRKVAGGTCGGTGRERQASAVGKGKARPETKELMEEVLRRENLAQRGLLSLLDEHLRFQNLSLTAVCRTARTVV